MTHQLRYGVYVSNSRATAEILLQKAIKEKVIWSNETVKGLLHDLVTLYDEVEHEREAKDYWRAQVNSAVRGAPRGW